ncbi:MAG TPA: hypothetical protein EYH34_08020 [Planctomycetes bacterium]|nr:hypothetical protein [Planctomycetota bacterium]
MWPTRPTTSSFSPTWSASEAGPRRLKGPEGLKSSHSPRHRGPIRRPRPSAQPRAPPPRRPRRPRPVRRAAEPGPPFPNPAEGGPPGPATRRIHRTRSDRSRSYPFGLPFHRISAWPNPWRP